MATIWYTDVATNQKQGVNFPGAPGSLEITTQPGSQNNALLEGPPEITATYLWTGSEVGGDTINIAIAPAGVIISPNGHVSSGLTAISSTLTFAIGDNDLAIASLLPIGNPQVVNQQTATIGGITAPAWVTGIAYAAGNVVYDSGSTPANLVYTCVAALTTSQNTAPHSAANTVWMPNNQRYSNSIDCHAAAGNVAFASGTQLYGGPASLLPYSIVPNQAAQAMTTSQILNQPYQIQADCWITATILTLNTTTLNANSVSVFRIGMTASN